MKVLRGNRRDSRQLRHSTPDVSPRALAEGLFQAAIHNAHWGQGIELVKYQCREALRIDQGMCDMMVRFVDSALRRAPSFICDSMEAIAKEAAYQGAAALH